jgi:NAD(P)H-nitrite reductase large subunit
MRRTARSHVIIGNSAAAISAIEAFRKTGNDEPILLISDEPSPSYSRPLISELLAGEISGERMLYRSEDFYAQHSVEPLLATRAEKVEPGRKAVRLQDGRRIPYKNLLIATGSGPIILPLEGVDLRGVFTFMGWREAEVLRRAAAGKRLATVIGGGLIGLKAAEALRHLGLEVSVVELAPRLLPAAADETASAVIEAHLRSHGLRIFTGNTVERIEGDEGQVRAVLLRSGERLLADMVIMAVGVRPNIEIVQRTSIQVRRGIVVDSHMRTSAPNVYAAGDAAEGYDLVMDENRLLPIWPAAYRQGAVAGANMAGEDKEYAGDFAMNSIELFHLPLISMGRLEAPQEPGYEVLSSSAENSCRKVILKNGVIVGALFLREIDRAGIFNGLIRERMPVEAFKSELLSDDFGLLSLPAEWRKAKLTPQPANKQ